MTGRRISRGRKKTHYYWDGLQWPETTLGSSRVILILVGTTATEFMGRTLVSVRGYLSFLSLATANPVRVASKLVLIELNDAGTITSDVFPIDTHEEDISWRQLWSYSNLLSEAPTAGNSILAGAQIEINVKVKIKLPNDGKHALALISQADVASSCSFAGYLRCLTAR